MFALTINDDKGTRTIACPTLVDTRKAVCVYALRKRAWMNTTAGGWHGVIAVPGTGVVVAKWQIVPVGASC